MTQPVLPSLFAALLLSACASAASVPTAAVTTTNASLRGDAAHPPTTRNWLRTELYFGIVLADQPDKGITEAQWRGFLDREVSTRFPDGLSVLDIDGQWRGKQQTQVERLRSKVIVLLHPDTPQQRDDIEAIRAAWKRMTGDQSVLRVSQPADVSF